MERFFRQFGLERRVIRYLVHEENINTYDRLVLHHEDFVKNNFFHRGVDLLASHHIQFAILLLETKIGIPPHQRLLDFRFHSDEFYGFSSGAVEIETRDALEQAYVSSLDIFKMFHHHNITNWETLVAKEREIMEGTLSHVSPNAIRTLQTVLPYWHRRENNLGGFTFQEWMRNVAPTVRLYRYD